ncbi:hypothetical protein CTAYLR_002258, partial [Chrysophaeum taylorii]
MERDDDTVVPQRRACGVSSVAPHVRRAVDFTRVSVHRGVQFVTTTPTSRYIAAVLTEATHYALERASWAVSAIQAHDPEWSYTDEVVKGERWLTRVVFVPFLRATGGCRRLGWYERQLVETNEGGDEDAPSKRQLPEGLDGPADFRSDDFARWVRDRALGEERDEEAGYHVAKLAVVAPAKWQLADACSACGERFGPSKHRHHCRLCGRSVCRAHGSRYRALPALAAHLGANPHRVCEECDARMDSLATAERAAWRVCRVKMLLRHRESGGLRPYFDVAVDTATNKARRLLKAAAAVARTCPLLAPASATITVEVLEILCKYGPAGLATLVLRREFVEAAELLRRVARVDAAWPLSAHELTAAIYYLLALRRGARGSDPDAEKRQFASCERCDEETLRDLRAAAPAAIWCYLESPTAVELVARQQGYALLFENGWGRQREAVAQPGFICLAKRDGTARRKTAILAVRGTASVHDVATDVRAFPAPFPPQRDFEGNGAWTSVSGTFAFAGMARAAQWLYDETAPALLALAAGGYDLVLTGHSLGAGVASLLSVMLRNGFDDRGLGHARVRCFGFATPACVDRALADKTVGLITSVVLHDDVVPRLTARSLRALMAELLRQRETCMRRWRDDLDAVWGRLRHGLWAPRWRDSLLRESAASSRIEASRDDESRLFPDEAPQAAAPPPPYLPPRGRTASSDDDDARFFADDFDDVDKLPELFVPGRVVHIYSWRGTYEAAIVDRGCEALADIAVSANMISDHSIQSHFDAITEVLDVRRAPENPPPWQPFHATDSCQCCGAKFTWHVTSNSEAQTYREKHNCRSCGLLVCDPCSKRRKPLPRIGLLEPSRVCDRCHFQGFSDNHRTVVWWWSQLVVACRGLAPFFSNNNNRGRGVLVVAKSSTEGQPYLEEDVLVASDPHDILDAEGWPCDEEKEIDAGLVTLRSEGEESVVHELARYEINDDDDDEELRSLLSRLRSEVEGKEDEESASIMRSIKRCEAYVEAHYGAVDAVADARAALAFAATTDAVAEEAFEDARSVGLLSDEGRNRSWYSGIDVPADLLSADDDEMDAAYSELLESAGRNSRVEDDEKEVRVSSSSIGIDLGTTNSAAAIVVDGVPRLVPPGMRPSVVCFVDLSLDAEVFVDEDDPAFGAALADETVLAVVGKDAEALRGGVHGASVCSRVKRILGRDATRAERRRVGTFRSHGGRDSDSDVALAIPALPFRVAASEVSAEIVRQLKRDADRFLAPLVATRAVVGIPARFDAWARDATRDATIRAGFDDVRLLTEPEAAAIAFGRTRSDASKNLTLLVFDLGGGTFDASVVRVRNANATLVSVGGDPRLGGDDFDAALAEYLAKRFYDAHNVSIRAPTARLRLLAEAERCKRVLSGRKEVRARARCLARANRETGERSRGGRPLDLNETLDRRTFESLCRPLFRDIEAAALAVCEEANISLPKIGEEEENGVLRNALDAVLLVGGATRMPAIGRMLRRITGLPLSRIVANDALNPEEAVALGAAIHAADLDARGVFPPDPPPAIL